MSQFCQQLLLFFKKLMKGIWPATAQSRQCLDFAGDFKRKSEISVLIKKFEEKQLSSVIVKNNSLIILELVLAVRFLIGLIFHRVESSKRFTAADTNAITDFQTADVDIDVEVIMWLVVSILVKQMIEIVLQIKYELWKNSIINLQYFLVAKLLLTVILFSEIFAFARTGGSGLKCFHVSELWLGLLTALQINYIMKSVLIIKYKVLTLVILFVYLSVRHNMFDSLLSDCFIVYYLIYVFVMLRDEQTKRHKILSKQTLQQKITQKSFYKQCLSLIPEGFCIFKTDYSILYNNGNLSKLFQLKQKGLEPQGQGQGFDNDNDQNKDKEKDIDQDIGKGKRNGVDYLSFLAQTILNLKVQENQPPVTVHIPEYISTIVVNDNPGNLCNRDIPLCSPNNIKPSKFAKNKELFPLNKANQSLDSPVKEGNQSNRSLPQSKSPQKPIFKYHTTPARVIRIDLKKCSCLKQVLDALQHHKDSINTQQAQQTPQNFIELKMHSQMLQHPDGIGFPESLMKQHFLSQQQCLRYKEKRSSIQVIQNFMEDLQRTLGQERQQKAAADSLNGDNNGKGFEDVVQLRVQHQGSVFLVKIYRAIIKDLSCDELGQQEVLLLVLSDVSSDQYMQRLSLENEQSKKQLAQTSHEFRTPLNCAIAMLEYLSNNNIPEDLNTNYLMPALFSIKLLLSLVNDILDFSQINAGKFSFSFARFKIRKTVAQAVQLISIQASLKKIKILHEVEKQVPTSMTSDANRLRQILLNLLSNALKFTKQGFIKVQVSVYKESPLTLQIQVIDTGIGIKKENQSKLFQCFGKINDQENRGLNAHGVGLGLVISNGLARGLGPDDSMGLNVQSEYGKGTTFGFLIVDKQDMSLGQLTSMYEENVMNSSQREAQNASAEKYGTKKSLAENPKSIYMKPSGFYMNQENIEDTLINEIQPQILMSQNNRLEPEKQLSLTHQLTLTQQQQQTSFSQQQQQQYQYQYSQHSQFSYSPQHRYMPQQSISSGTSSLSIFQSQQQQQLQHQNSDMHSEIILRNLKSKFYAEKGCFCSRVLVVDDNQFNQLIFLRSFEKFLHNVETANNGPEAIEKVHFKLKSECCKFYKIIFMDIEMPEMNGFEAAREIIKILEKENLKQQCYIVACSGYNEDDAFPEMQKCNLKHYLQKPVEKKALKRLLKLICDQQQQEI